MFEVAADLAHGFIVVYREEDGSRWRPCFRTLDKEYACAVADTLNNAGILNEEFLYER
jgi:hypothetical protein